MRHDLVSTILAAGTKSSREVASTLRLGNTSAEAGSGSFTVVYQGDSFNRLWELEDDQKNIDDSAALDGVWAVDIRSAGPCLDWRAEEGRRGRAQAQGC